MPRLSLAFARCAPLGSSLVPKLRLARLSYSTQTSAAAKAQHILELSAPLKDDEPSVLRQQNQFLQQLGGQPENEEIELAFKVFDKVISLSKGVDKFSCARLSLMCLNGGMPDRALEPWARLLEALGSRTYSRAALERILDNSDFEPAALSALVAYFVIAGPTADPETARKLVPRKRVPTNLSVLRNLGGIKSSDAEQIAMRGLAALQRHVSNGFTDAGFLDQVASSPYAETQKLWQQVQQAAAPNEIPEVCYAAFIRRFAETRQSQRAFEIWQQLVSSGVKVSTTAWVALMHAALCAPKNSEALFSGIWEKMIANGFTPDAACMAERMLFLAHHRGTDETFNAFSALRKEQPSLIDVRGLNVVVSSLVRAKRLEEADEALQWAIDNGVEPNAHTYNSLISSRNPEVGLKYLQAMMERGIKPSIVTYTFAMQQMLKRGQPIDELLAEMQAAKIEPNERFNTTLSYYLGKQTGDLSTARASIRSIIDKRLRLSIETLGAFIELELRHGDVERAVEYTSLMHRFGLTPSLPTYNQLIRGALRRQRIGIARQTFDKLVNGKMHRLRPNTFTYMFLLKPWTLADLQGREDVRELVKTVAQHLEQQTEWIDHALAKRIEVIASETGSQLISPALRHIASEQVLKGFDHRLAPKE